MQTTTGRRPLTLALTLLVALLGACSGDDTGAGSDSGTGTDSGTGGPADTGPGGAMDSGGGDTGPGTPATCGDTALTQWEQNILDRHNEWRGSADPPAANMLRVYWDRNIADNAANWVASCDPEWPHSSEEYRSGVGGYEVLGENLSMCGGSSCEDDPEITDGSGIGEYGQGWWDERADYNWEDDSSTGLTSHYTQMASSNIYAIGCAAQRCDAPGPDGWDGTWVWTICQYGPRGRGYWVGTKPYDAGEGGLVEPPASIFDDHPGLCGP